MTLHHHTDNPWRVRIDDAQGVTRGAGVLLDERYVLTCGHVVVAAGAHPDGPAPELSVRSTVCRPAWHRSAHVAPGSWVYRPGSRRRDVALLELAAAPGCGLRTSLWQVPVSGGRVRAYGFPAVERYGISADAELAGSGGPEGELCLLQRVREGDQWIEPGFSGAGATALDGSFSDRVVGIVSADYVNGDAKAAWMLPTESILRYLPQLAEFRRGVRRIEFPHDGGSPREVLADPLRLALTRELTGLLDSAWTGTAVVGTGDSTGVGAAWLVRLARSSDPASTSDDELDERPAAPSGTVLGFGAIDAAYDARDRATGDVVEYLAKRFGLDDRAGPAAVVSGLLRRQPPACVVVNGVDRAADPAELVTGLLAPLALRAGSRGTRLVLGFDEPPPDSLPYDVYVGNDVRVTALPRGGAAALAVTVDAARGCVARLAEAETEAFRVQKAQAERFLAAPRIPRAQAPALRVALAVVGAGRPGPGPGAVRAAAEAASTAVARYVDAVRKMAAEHEELSVSLDLHRVRAARLVGAEDRHLGTLYVAAARSLQLVPVDLDAARRQVPRYVEAINRAVAEGAR